MQTLKNIILQYIKNLNLDDFDETIFLNEKNVSNSPSKFTPFSKQGVKNQLKCQRILNYEAKTQNENVTVNHNISQMVNKIFGLILYFLFRNF